MNIQLENAGLCLVTPFLPDYFKILGLANAQNFNSAISATRAIGLLDYVATGKLSSNPSTNSLSRFLCGKENLQIENQSTKIKSIERSESKKLLRSVIANWNTLKNTSIDGLRENFLRRPGILRFENEAKILSVERKGIDIILDQIPWSYKTIYFHWMQQTIQVEW